MNWKRIQTILLHSWYHANHSMETWMDLFWFSIVGALVYGFTMQFFAQDNPQFAAMLIIGMIMWEVVRAGQYSVTIGMMWEIWSKSFSSMFITPLTMAEWVVGQMISATIKTGIVVVLVSTISFFAFQFSIFQFGLMFLVYSGLLLFFSFAAGLFISALILRFGTDIQSLAWALIFMLQPLSAVFYPLSVLPEPVRWVAYTSPITYVMEASRHQFMTQTVNWSQIGIATLLTAIYFAGSYWFLDRMYKRSRKVGSFGRLGN
jgi:ABC-2 type transport system permease protein